MSVRIGVDIGGTFTDVVLSDDSTGELFVAKTPSTPDSFEDGVLNGIVEILQKTDTEPDAVTFLSHATTVATNAVLEEKLPPVGLITTDGFRDVLEIGKQVRPDPFDLQEDKPPAVIPRERRMEVAGRIDSTGTEMEPLDEAQVHDAVRRLADQDVQSIVVSLLFSFLNDGHERRVGEIIEEHGINYALSADVIPERREYERTITTVINESAKQVIERYLAAAERGLAARGIDTPLNLMHCGGGVFSVDQAIDNAVRTITSGPAAGAVATERIATAEAADMAIGLDMGGTSTDVSIVRNGDIVRSTEKTINELPIEIPMVDINTVGAGGGSLARVDAGGVLRVGPESAGADPGPICYGKGGDRPTVTDANLLLGRLNPDKPIGDGVDLDADRAAAVFESKIAEPLGMGLEEAASSVLEVAHAVLVRNIRKVTIERGDDPERFALVGFGGMGPQVAAEVAADMNMNSVIVPRNPGVFSAGGLLQADFRVQESLSFSGRGAERSRAVEQFETVRETVADRMAAQGFDEDEITLEFTADMRYKGQAYELAIPVAEGVATAAAIESSVDEFHGYHERRYGYAIPENTVEITTLRVTGRRPIDAPDPTFATSGQDPYLGTRSVYFGDHGYVDAAVYDRAGLEPGQDLAGPAIVEEEDSTTTIPPGLVARVSEMGSILIELTH